jgi:hypothetical protein
LLGVDLTGAGTPRAKAYFPGKDDMGPLPLATFAAFLTYAGIPPAVLDDLGKVGYFLLKGSLEVVPTGFIVGIAIGQSPSVKLEVATKAYFQTAEQVVDAACSLALLMDMDPLFLRTGVQALCDASPLERPLNAHVACVDFCQDGRSRLALYCRL